LEAEIKESPELLRFRFGAIEATRDPLIIHHFETGLMDYLSCQGRIMQYMTALRFAYKEGREQLYSAVTSELVRKFPVKGRLGLIFL
jgi:hypothetical protein